MNKQDALNETLKSLKDSKIPLTKALQLITQAMQLLTPVESERICGLTMDEWQVVIDGGYLIAVSSNSPEAAKRRRSSLTEIHKLRRITEDNTFTIATDGRSFNFAYAVRVVGHVQPYFDNDECREYLDGLSDEAIIVRHYSVTGWTRPETKREVKGLYNIDKFIVLSNE